MIEYVNVFNRKRIGRAWSSLRRISQGGIEKLVHKRKGVIFPTDKRYSDMSYESLHFERALDGGFPDEKAELTPGTVKGVRGLRTGHHVVLDVGGLKGVGWMGGHQMRVVRGKKLLMPSALVILVDEKGNSYVGYSRAAVETTGDPLYTATVAASRTPRGRVRVNFSVSGTNVVRIDPEATRIINSVIGGYFGQYPNIREVRVRATPIRGTSSINIGASVFFSGKPTPIVISLVRELSELVRGATLSPVNISLWALKRAGYEDKES